MLVTGCKLQVTGYRLQVAGYRLQVTGCWLQVTGCWLLVYGKGGIWNLKDNKYTDMKKTILLLACLGGIVIAKAQKEPGSPAHTPKVEDVKRFVPPVITATGKEGEEFYKRNPSIDKISRQGDILTLNMKDKKIEMYDLRNKEQEKKFTDKYGAVPIPAPPKPKN